MHCPGSFSQWLNIVPNLLWLRGVKLGSMGVRLVYSVYAQTLHKVGHLPPALALVLFQFHMLCMDILKPIWNMVTHLPQTLFELFLQNSSHSVWLAHLRIHLFIHPPPPPCQWPGPCFFFREGGSMSKGGHVSAFEGGGGGIDTHMGGPLTQIVVKTPKKILCARICFSLWHRCTRGGSWHMIWMAFKLVVCTNGLVTRACTLPWFTSAGEEQRLSSWIPGFCQDIVPTDSYQWDWV